MPKIMRISIYVVLGVLLGLVLRFTDAPEWSWRICTGFAGGLIALLLASRWRRSRNKAVPRCMVCRRPATGQFRTEDAWGRLVEVRHCEIHYTTALRLAVALR